MDASLGQYSAFSLWFFFFFLMLMSSVGIDYEDYSPLPGMIISFLMREIFKNSKEVDKT